MTYLLKRSRSSIAPLKVGHSFDSSEAKASTRAFLPFGETRNDAKAMQGVEKPTACLLRCELVGTALEVFAWGCGIRSDCWSMTMEAFTSVTMGAMFAVHAR